MTCPNASQWHALSMNLLDEPDAADLLRHARQCPACRQALLDARRDHERLIRACEALDRTHAAEREQLMATLTNPVGASQTPRLRPGVIGRIGDLLMRINTPIIRRSAAVLVPAACLLLAIVLLVHTTPQSAFAAAIEQFRRAQTISCKISMPEGLKVGGVRLAAEGKLMMSEQYGSTSSLFMNGMEIQRHYAKTGGPMIMVQPVTKTWMTLDVSEIAFTETNEQTPDAFIRGLAKLRDGDSAELDKQTIDGHAAIGYRIPGLKLGFVPRRDSAEQAYAELWVDESSRLPVRFVVSMPIPNADGPMVMYYDHFEWDVPLPASMFEPNIPDDYTRIEAKFTRPSEEALLNALRRLSDLMGGKYPPQFDAVSVLGRVHSMVPEENRHKLDELGMKGMVQLGLEIGGGTMYIMQLAKDGHDPEYFGDEVTTADTNKPLVRWKLDDGQMRVIYGDLHVETVPAQR